ncbi:hypothetical protein J2X57_001993 [Luteibacter sp. 1214]|uniref:hypothetical protein n=1 Tax=Luteibacter sp. 1214 TaxID=2817735 RepID=UPI00285550E8|nr:hypothetical protein [Luteibacter sp. 1214]MDR6642781.1 hypothetical protein [Luteibacter sp. 1214]
MKSIHTLAALLLLAPVAASWAAEPVCCASGDNGKPKGRAAVASSSELGKTSPASSNLSLSPEYQVFEFTREGLRYVEVADAAGVPRAAFTIVSGSVLALPVGTDAVQQVAIAPAWTDVVYDDGTITVARRVASDGALVWQVFVK